MAISRFCERGPVIIVLVTAAEAAADDDDGCCCIRAAFFVGLDPKASCSCATTSGVKRAVASLFTSSSAFCAQRLLAA